VSTGAILGLGAIAGFTIFVGLPVGRMRRISPAVRTLLNSVAIGILVFLIVDVLEHAIEPVECRLDVVAGKGACDGGPTNVSWLGFSGFAALLAVGFGIGLLTLVYYDRVLPKRRSRTAGVGPGAAAVQEFRDRDVDAATAAARRLAIVIAVGIGLHNFAEGLAIGQSAAKGEIALAVLLVVGFGLHNATEGFGIVGPLAGSATPPTWAFLGALGLIGGGPTFLGTVVGQAFTSDAVSVLFLALAAGSILYVVIQLVGVALRAGHKEMLYWGVFVGVIAGFATDFIVGAAGG
jgi:zinc transporter, ZIP family